MSDEDNTDTFDNMEPLEGKTFFMVLNATKRGSTCVAHKTIERANAEAKRLAERQPGDVFAVIENRLEWKAEQPEAKVQ